MSEVPKRPFWQFHLSTAMVLVFLCAGISGVNFQERALISSTIQYPDIITGYGWPFVAIEIINISNSGSPLRPIHVSSKRWIFTGIILDCMACISVLVSFGIILEWVIRRREGRKR